jgi:hypothetical protein
MLVFTLSVQGVLIGVIYLLLSAYCRKDIKFFVYISIFSILLLLIGHEYVSGYIEDRFTYGVLNDASFQKKIFPYSFWIDSDSLRIINGSGLFVDDCNCLIRDAGFGFNIIYHHGVIGFIYIVLSLLLIYFSFKNHGRNLLYIIVLFLLIYTSKIAIFSGYFHLISIWLFLYLTSRLNKGKQ